MLLLCGGAAVRCGAAARRRGEEARSDRGGQSQRGATPSFGLSGPPRVLKSVNRCRNLIGLHVILGRDAVGGGTTVPPLVSVCLKNICSF